MENKYGINNKKPAKQQVFCLIDFSERGAARTKSPCGIPHPLWVKQPKQKEALMCKASQ